MSGPKSRLRGASWAALALAVFAGAVAANYYARAQQDTVRGRFEKSCVDGCVQTGAPKAACRDTCACLLTDLETGRTDAELEQLLLALEAAPDGQAPEMDELRASQERCLSELQPGG